MTQGIYAITHIPSGRVYVGQSRDIEARFNNHKVASLSRREREGFPFYELLSEKPLDFSLAILESVQDVGDLHNREQHWIKAFDSTNPEKGFNRRYEDPAQNMHCLPAGVRNGIEDAIAKRGVSVQQFELATFGRLGKRSVSKYLSARRRILPPDFVQMLDALGLELTVKPKAPERES